MEHWNYNKKIGIKNNRFLGNTNTDNLICKVLVKHLLQVPVLRNIKILEPSVGGGSFYFSIIDFLLNLGYKINYIVENMVYACDIDPECIKILKSTLSSQYGYQSNKKTKIFCEDFLLKQFDIKFDFIIGNPPYISSKNISSTLFPNKNDYINTINSFNNLKIDVKSDIYMYFYMKSLNLLNKEGILSFLCSDSWIDSSYGQPLIDAILSDEFSILEIVNSQIAPFFRDDTNAIITTIKKSKTKYKTFLTPFRKNDISILFEKESDISLTKEELKSIFNNTEFINKRNALVLFPDFYQNNYMFFHKKKHMMHFKDFFLISNTSLTKNTLLKSTDLFNVSEKNEDNMIPIFWQQQARINKKPNYKNLLKQNDLIYFITSEQKEKKYENNFVENNVYLSTIIDRYPLLFCTDFKTFHVSKYFSITCKNKTMKPLEIIYFINNIFTLLDIENRLKEGTRKTLRKGECGLAKEIKKGDLEDIFIPDLREFNFSSIYRHIDIIKNKIIYNVEDAILDKEYMLMQINISKYLNISKNEFVSCIKNLLFLYVLRMRNVNKIQNFKEYVMPFTKFASKMW